MRVNGDGVVSFRESHAERRIKTTPSIFLCKYGKIEPFLIMLTPEKARSAVSDYFNELSSKFKTGQAGEHAYRPAFEKLIKGIDSKINPMNDPKRSEHGAPDFVFIRGAVTAGYTETKDIGEDLDKVEKSDQMKRYFGYSNLILTDYLEFRFFKNGSRANEPIVIGMQKGMDLVAYPERFAELANTLSDFLQGVPEPITSGKRLAEIMGGKAHRIRDNVQRFLGSDSEKNAELLRIYETIKRLLVHDLSTDKFADMYAQTLVYGLFVARYNDDAKVGFTRQKARDLVSASNPFLREFFDHIVGPRFDTRLCFIVDELCAVFSVSDIREIVHHHFKVDGDGKDEKDPIIHFYEDFLQEYDPAERKKMGAYYTPIPVARFIVRAVDEALKRDFGLQKGLADTSKRQVQIVSQGKKVKVDVHRVQILDPAVGTATFLNEVVNHIHKSFEGQQGRWASYVETDLLPRLFGFELMMAPYTIAHLKLGMTLRESGCNNFKQRLGVYLTNTLEEGLLVSDTLWGVLGLSQVIADEAAEAGRIKKERPIMVVIGNPPYSGVSSNETVYANQLIAKYKVEPGGKMKLQERKHWLNDDYVKFIAFAEDLIEKNGEGIVAMITNHGYLDNPTFRGMRWHLAKTFDSIHVLDLHGNSKKNETAPDGGKDENVFNIQQGVAIMVAVKTGKKKAGEQARVFHSNLFGKREEKFRELEAFVQNSKELQLDEQMYYFIEKNIEGKSNYENGIALNELFNVFNTSIVTMGDSFIVSENKSELEKRIEKFTAGDYNEQELNEEFSLGKNYAKWILSNRNKITFDKNKIIPLNYRPFDQRFTYYDNKLVWRHRENVMKHFLRGDNLGLVFRRQQLPERQTYYFVSNGIIADGYIRSDNKGGESIAPLYLYRDDGTRTPNFDRDTLKTLTQKLHKAYEPEDVLDYIYAVLHSPKYRETYKEFLKSDFPRVPSPTDDGQFHRLAAFGKQLRELHLLTSSAVNNFITIYPKDGSNVVEKIERKETGVWTNKEQYFGNVPEVAWNFYIGGYQPAQKWLKDRKGRTLSNEDIEHYQKMIVALTETERIMKEIDTSS
jgi:predicted helicase